MKTRLVLALAMAAAMSWTWGGEPGPGPGPGEGEGDRRGQDRRQEHKRAMARPMPGDREGLGPMDAPGGGLEGGMVLRLLQKEWLVKELGITEEQIAGLKKSAEETEAEMKKLRTEMETAAMQQAKLISEKVIDETAVLEAVERTGQVRTEMAKLRIRQLLTVKKLLTREQLEKLNEMRERRMREGDGPARGEIRERLRERMEQGGGADREEIRERIRERLEKRRKDGGPGRKDDARDEGADKPGMENFRD